MNVKKDVTKPSCSISTSGTSGSNGWYRGNVTLNLNYSDAMSGVAGYGMGTSSSANYNSKSTNDTDREIHLGHHIMDM